MHESAPGAGRACYAAREVLENSAVPTNPPSCPAHSCKGANAEQRAFPTAALSSAGVAGDWLSHALRCDHCGCVYSVAGKSKTVRGYFDNPIFPDGWRPIYVGSEATPAAVAARPENATP